MALAEKYLNHPQFLKASTMASDTLVDLASEFGVCTTLDDYETAAGNVVDDITRLLLIMIDAKAVKKAA